MSRFGNRTSKGCLSKTVKKLPRFWLVATYICGMIIVVVQFVQFLFDPSVEGVRVRVPDAVVMSPMSKNLALDHILGLSNKPPPKRFCPCCGWSGSLFAKHQTRPDRKCPVCGAFERHRKFCAISACHEIHGGFRFQIEETGSRSQSQPKAFQLLHFGAERHMYDLIDRLEPKVKQFGLDFFSPGYAYDKEIVHHADVTNLVDFQNGTADGVIILHVLEHIRDLDAALGEIRRVLKPGSGWAYIEVPCFDLGRESKDCRGFKTKDELIKCAGQHDHVWRFDCHNFEQDLKRSGLVCRTVGSDLQAQKKCLDPIIHQSLHLDKMPSYLCHNGMP